MPGKEVLLRPEPRQPAMTAPPWPQRQDRASESAAVRTWRWLRRNGHVTVPLGVLPGLWLAGLILHQAGAALYVLLGGGILAGCVWVFAPHKWDRPEEQWYARLSAALSVLWLILSAWLGPLSGTVTASVLGGALSAGCAVWGYFWWQHKRPRGMRKRQKLIAQLDAWWLSHCHQWDLHGSRVIDAHLSGVTLRIRVRGLPGRHTVHHYRAAVPGIESAAEGQSDIGLVRVEPVKGKPCEADVFLKRENPLRGPVEYDMALGPRSVHEPAPFGRTESGTWKMISLRKNRFTIGTTRTGKSNDLLTGVVNISGCPDGRPVLIDLKGGRSARPVLAAAAAEYVITERDEARMFLRMLVAEILMRAKYAYDGNEQLLATPDVPAFFGLIDETHGLTSVMNGDPECARLLATIASQGSGLEVYAWVYTQFGSLEESVATEQTRGNLPLRTCYRVEEARHGQYVIPEYSRLDASKLEEKGTCYVKDGPNVLPEQVRAPHMPHALLTRIATQNARLLGARPPLVLYCGSEMSPLGVTWQQWWDTRWLRLDPAFRKISPQHQAAVAEHPQAAAAVIDVAQRAAGPVPSPGPGAGDSRSAAARITGEDADLMARVPDDFRPDPAIVKRLPAAVASQEDRFADALESAAADSPVTPKHLMEASGFRSSWVHDRITALAEIGQVTQVSRGQYVAVPGADIRRGLREIKDRNDRLNREARRMINAA